MTRTPHRSLGCAIALYCAAGILLTAAPARAEDSVAQAKVLYTAASYEEALSALGATDTAEAQEYRGLCLMALGRLADAERAIETLIDKAPAYTLTGEERPPRFVALFASTRRRVLPAVVRRMFAEARSDFQAKSYDRAKKQFDQVLGLVDDPLLKDSPETADLRLLAAGFGDLVNAAVAPAAPAAPVGDIARATVAPTPRTVVQPTLVRQLIPPVPSAIAAAGVGLSGTLRLKIGADGRVKSATIEKPLHPQYDLDLLGAARSWLFTPATINGSPIEAEQLVPVKIVPPTRDTSGRSTAKN